MDHESDDQYDGDDRNCRQRQDSDTSSSSSSGYSNRGQDHSNHYGEYQNEHVEHDTDNDDDYIDARKVNLEGDLNVVVHIWSSVGSKFSSSTTKSS